jgi:hypothetical protein
MVLTELRNYSYAKVAAKLYISSKCLFYESAQYVCTYCTLTFHTNIMYQLIVE